MEFANYGSNELDTYSTFLQPSLFNPESFEAEVPSVTANFDINGNAQFLIFRAMDSVCGETNEILIQPTGDITDTTDYWLDDFDIFLPGHLLARITVRHPN